MDDIQEYAQMRRDAETQQKRSMMAAAAGSSASSASKSKAANVSHDDAAAAAVARQTRAEAIRERIGFDPTPRNS